MPFRLSLLFALAIAPLFCAPGLHARSYDPTDPYSRQRSENDRGEFRYDDSKDAPWEEDAAGRVQVPPPPEEGTLAELRLDTLPRPFTAYLDTNTLSVSPSDGVLRYWLVIRSGSSSTVSFEGMNCRTREYKVYAFADAREPDGLRPMREPRWQPLGFNQRSDYRWELADSYLCVGVDAKKPKDVIGTIRGYYQRANPFSEYRDNARPW